jgi:hypothetical protein
MVLSFCGKWQGADELPDVILPLEGEQKLRVGLF